MKVLTRLKVPKVRSLRLGFTLIEILVVVSILLMLTGSGLAAYLRYSERQSAEIMARELHDVLVSARSRARFKERANCADTEGVVGFRALMTSSGISLNANILAICGNDRVNYDLAGDPVNVPANSVSSADYNVSQFVISPLPLQIDFFSLYGGAQLPGNVNSIDITVARGAASYRFTVDRGGDITPVIKFE